MFKNIKKKTKIIFGTAAVSAMVFFPIVTIGAAGTGTATTPPTSLASGTVSAIKDDFMSSGRAAKEISTPQNVFTVNGVGTSQFTDKDTASKFLLDTPKILDNYVPGATAAFNTAAADAVAKAGMLSFGTGGYKSGQTEFNAFLSPDKLKMLYKNLNPGMDKKAQGKTRFNFMVPSNVMPITGYDATTKTPTMTRDASYDSKEFVYKVASIDPTQFVENESLSLDYMYDAGTGNTRKVQLVIPHSDDLVNDDDSVTIKSLFDNHEMFFRTMDESDRGTSGDIKNNITKANSGLSIVKEDGEIAIYSTLDNKLATSSIMIDDSSTKAATTATTIGILGESTQYGGLTMAPKDSKPENKVESFKEYTFENDWTKVSNYQWSDNSISDVETITFYMKKGTQLTNIKTTWGKEADKLPSVTIKAGDLNVEVTPKTPIQVEPDKFDSDDKTFEIKSQSNGGDWYKVSIFVDTASNPPFLLNSGNGSGEGPWKMKSITEQAPIFFENPIAPKTFTGRESTSTLAIEKKINDDAVTKEVYRDVYGSWIAPDPQNPSNLLKPDVIKALNTLGKVGSEKLWSDFKYYYPKKDTLDFGGDNVQVRRISSSDTMVSIIDQLSDYHDYLNSILKANSLTIDDDNKDGSYKPTEISDFDTLFQQYIRPTAGADLAKVISDKIIASDQITKVPYASFESDLALWNSIGHKDYIAAYTDKGPTDQTKVNFFDLQKKYPTFFDELINIVCPANPSDLTWTTSGNITIAKFVQRDIEQIIPKLFGGEFERFKTKMAGIKGKRFAKFLGTDFDTKILNPSSITNGVSKESGIHFSDISSSPTFKTAKNGSEIIEDITKLIYKTGIYKTVFAGKPAQEELFVKLYDEDKDTSLLWDESLYFKGDGKVQEMLDIIDTMLNNLQPDSANAVDFQAMLEAQDSTPGANEYVGKIKAITQGAAETFNSQKIDVNDPKTYVDFRWTAGNDYKGTDLQKQIALSNIENVVEYLRSNDKAKILGDKLDFFIKTFTANQQSADAIAQLGPTLGRYKIGKFIPGFTTDPVQTEEIVEQMVHVDPIRVLIPNTGQSKTFEVLENKGGAATLGLVVAAGGLMVIIGGILIGLSFTKRIVVNGKTWSAKMIIIRAALLAIAVVGIYMVLTGTVLPGHTALTTIVNV